MDKDNNHLVPRLRFKEFSEEWEERKLGDVLDYLQPAKYLVHSEDYNEKYETPVLTAGKSFVLGYTNEKDGIFKDALPVIIFDDFTTATQFVDFPFKAKSSAMKILTGKKNHNVKFYYELMQTIKFEVGAHQRHWISLFSKLHVPTTSSQEQQKIADTLSSLDTLIESEQAKLAKLQEHKKGLMQNLFPQEGESMPKVRFKEFENDGEWEEKELGDVGSFIGGGTPSTIDQNYWNGDILWLTPTEIKGGMVTDSIRKITKLGLENSSAKLLPIGAILITTRATIGDVGIASKPCTTNQGFQSLVVNIDQSNLFWYYWIIANKQELIRCASGSTFPEISKNEIKQIIALTPSFQEQQKIASTLSSLDNLISSQAKRIELLQQHKKGLMQGMFPMNNE